jgi:type VI secretion system VasD/TssJ family lipoprotein
MIRVSRASLLLLTLLLGTAGCGLFSRGAAPAGPEAPAGPSGPATVQLTGQANMNAGGNSARVYFYALVSDATFLATPVQAFWDDPEGVLGSDLVGPARDATVRPGETTTIEELALGTAAFLGVAADLRSPRGGSWRAVLPASQVRGQTLRVMVTEGGLSVTAR